MEMHPPLPEVVVCHKRASIGGLITEHFMGKIEAHRWGKESRGVETPPSPPQVGGGTGGLSP